MPIVNMISNTAPEFPEGAACHFGSSWNTPADRAKWRQETIAGQGKLPHGPVITYETHHGLCLSEREHNMRDDSDFYMTVWNPAAGKAEVIMFATTRGWSYPCLGSRPDATPEVRAAYEAWQRQEQRLARVRGRLAARAADKALAADLGLPSYHHARRLRLAMGQHRHLLGHEIGSYSGPTRYNAFQKSFFGELSAEFCAVAKLLRTKTFRSAFRQSLAEQARAWALDMHHHHPRPLSARQIGSI